MNMNNNNNQLWEKPYGYFGINFSASLENACYLVVLKKSLLVNIFIIFSCNFDDKFKWIKKGYRQRKAFDSPISSATFESSSTTCLWIIIIKFRNTSPYHPFLIRKSRSEKTVTQVPTYHRTDVHPKLREGGTPFCFRCGRQKAVGGVTQVGTMVSMAAVKS